MNYFEKYVSNSCAGSGNQLIFHMEENEIRTGRLFYKIFAGGEYNYSVLFSNILDSTYNKGEISWKNYICDSFEIHSARIGKCKSMPIDKPLSALTVSDIEENKNTDIVVSDFKEVTFNGCSKKEVMPGEFFATDEVLMNFEKGEYLCLELTFSGTTIPYHEESLLPVFVKNSEGEWEYSKKMPFAGMIGCDRKVKSKIAYLGDSITQGIGAGDNTYLHWNALLSEKIGEDYGYWNLGIGFGRANDAASGGAWLYKALKNDLVIICFGVNDILKDIPEQQIKNDLMYIVKKLKEAGIKVIIQSVPPFGYSGEYLGIWNRVNEFIENEIVPLTDGYFNNVPILGKSGEEHVALYGGHPNAEGNRIWAEGFYKELTAFGVIK